MATTLSHDLRRKPTVMLTVSQYRSDVDSATGDGSPAGSSAGGGSDVFLLAPNFLDAPSSYHNRHLRYGSADGDALQTGRKHSRRRSAGGRHLATSIGGAALSSTDYYRSPLLKRRSPSIIRLSDNKHFHYDSVELGPTTVRLCLDGNRFVDGPESDLMSHQWTFSVDNGMDKWRIYRTANELAAFDRQLHRCVFERRYSRLIELAAVLPASADGTAPLISASASSASTSGFASSFSGGSDGTPLEVLLDTMNVYLERLSQLTGSLMTCYPVLKFLELNSRGNHFVPIETTHINTPAIAVAIVIRDFDGRLPDQLNLRVGDIVSVVEMGAASEDGRCFWRGKLTVPRAPYAHNKRRRKSERRTGAAVSDGNGKPSASRLFQVGSFPRDCVRIFTGKLDFDAPTTSDATALPEKPLRYETPQPSLVNGSARSYSGVKSRMSRDNGEAAANGRVFGVDLQAHLRESCRELPFVLTSCINVIENHGIVTGIYRQCGIQSNIRRLRWEFDNGLQPNLLERGILCDIHCVASLLKQYFRQLPDPLFNYAIYDDLLQAYGRMDGGCGGHGQTLPAETVRRIYAIQEVVRRLPDAYFRTAICLMNHLSRISKFQDVTDMTASNLAIVWAPNLLRSPPQKDAATDEAHLLLGLDVHKSLCTFLITHASTIFGPRQQIDAEEVARNAISRTVFAPSPRPSSSTTAGSTDEHNGLAPKFIGPQVSKDQCKESTVVRNSTPSCSTAESSSCHSSDGANKSSIRWRRGGGAIRDFGRSVRDSIIQPLRWHRQTSVVTASRDETLPTNTILGKMAAPTLNKSSPQTLNGILSNYNDNVTSRSCAIKHSSVSPSLELHRQLMSDSPPTSTALNSPCHSASLWTSRRHNPNSDGKHRKSLLISSNFINLEEHLEINPPFFEHFSRETNNSELPTLGINDPKIVQSWDRIGQNSSAKPQFRQVTGEGDINNKPEKLSASSTVKFSPKVARADSPNERCLKITNIEVSSSESLPLDVSRYDNVVTPLEKSAVGATALRIRSRVRNASHPRPMSTPLACLDPPPLLSSTKDVAPLLSSGLTGTEWTTMSQPPRNFSTQIMTSYQTLGRPQNHLYYF